MRVYSQRYNFPLTIQFYIHTPVQWHGWTQRTASSFFSHICVIILLYAFLIFVRGYTLFPMIFPLIRRYSVAWHGLLMTIVLNVWKNIQAKRMTGVSMNGEMSRCPFSMLVAPVLKNEQMNRRQINCKQVGAPVLGFSSKTTVRCDVIRVKFSCKLEWIVVQICSLFD